MRTSTRLPGAQQAQPEEVGGEDTGEDEDQERDDDTDARDVEAEQRLGARAFRQQQQDLSSDDTRKCSTQIVMPSGTQTTRPAIT